MKSKSLIILVLMLLSTSDITAQSTDTDSAFVVRTFHELVTICKSVDFADPKVSSLGAFYKAAPYIVYRGEDKDRAWKDFANYATLVEKNGVDNVCFKINSTVNQDSAHKIIKYFTQQESEGLWHIIQVSYYKKSMPKMALFAFLKVNDRFGLGDID